MNPPIKVLLVDDHPIVRAGFKQLLAIFPEIKVIAEAERGEQAIQLIQQVNIDVIIMDLSMPGIGGLETIRRICLRQTDSIILVFSVHEEQVYIERAMAAGAKGYISKNSAPEILPEAILSLAQGKQYIEKALQYSGMQKPALGHQQGVLKHLTSREFDVFLLLAKGNTLQNTADQLCISYKTAANYNTSIKRKLQASTITEYAHLAISAGIITH